MKKWILPALYFAAALLLVVWSLRTAIYVGLPMILIGVVVLLVLRVAKRLARRKRRTHPGGPVGSPTVATTPGPAAHEARVWETARAWPKIAATVGCGFTDGNATRERQERERADADAVHAGGSVERTLGIASILFSSMHTPTSNLGGQAVELRGQIVAVPKVVNFDAIEEEDRLSLELPHGLTVDHVQASADLLAAAYRARRVLVDQPEGFVEAGCVRLRIVYADVLAGVRESVSRGIEDEGELRVGRLDEGTDALVDVNDASHIAIQGMTRSGKSAFCYTLLSQLAPHEDVLVGGIDPNRVLLSPWKAVERSRDWLALGSDSDAAASLLNRYVTEMKERLDQLDAEGIEKFEDFTPERPLLVIVLEEYPGMLASAAAADAGRKAGERIAPAMQRAVASLVQEGAKVGVRVILIAQRMDASIVDGATRGQFGTRITFAVDNGDGVRMLHPQAPPELIEQVVTFPPGRAIFWKHRHTSIMQADFTEYPEYRRRLGASAPAATEQSTDVTTA